jgi:chromosome segregation ATPase
MNYADSHGKITKFSRTVKTLTSSDYQINDNKVTPLNYRDALQAININIKAHNFLVYQSAVERIAIQTPKALTAMFEELSRLV